jgi:hypothetical protein
MNGSRGEHRFTISEERGYDHTQHAPLYGLFVLPAVILLVVAGRLPPQQAPASFALFGAAGVLGVLALSFRQLTVRDEGDCLALRFGPLPLLRKRIRYADILAAERSRSTLVDGWGIHWVPGRGWSFNLWGFDCVRLTLSSGQTIRVGTDAPDGLAQFLQQRRGGPSDSG